VTYDAGLKGYLREWSWADDQILVARAEITDEAGHEIIENRIYVFHMKEQALSRLDLTALNLKDTDGLEVTNVGSDLNHLKISVGGKDFTVKTDLHTPPSVEKQQESAMPPKLPPSVQPPTPTPPTPAPTATPNMSPMPSTPDVQTPAPVVERKSSAWLWVVGIAALTVIALLVWKRRA